MTPRTPIAAVLVALFAGSTARAASTADVQEIQACLRLQDVACAQEVVEREGLATSTSPAMRAVAADVAFHAADHPRAYDLMASAVADGFEDPSDRLPLFERTMYATAGFVEEQRGRYRIRYRPGVEAILVDAAAEALAATDAKVVPLLGEPPPGSTVVELYPDGRSFIAASSLTKDDVEASGAIAISKWTRLLVSSPRSTARGYDWLPTVSHEYLHLVVSHATGDRAPVWLQEAIAKHLDHAYTGAEPEITRRQQDLLADALDEDDLVPFSEMHPSLAKIKVYGADGQIDAAASSKRSATAYAQLASLMQYAFQQGGRDVLLETLPMVKDGTDPRVALAAAAGASDFDTLVRDWETWLRSQQLADPDLRDMPTVLDGGDDVDADPVMSKRRDLANFLRLGDLLAERERYRAALVEYDKARDEEDPTSPLLSNRQAAALVALGQRDRARELVARSAEDYPTYAMSWRTLAEIDLLDGRRADAARHLDRARALSPFDLWTQTARLEVARDLGDTAAIRRQEAIVRILERGGRDEELEPIHERSGTYELPRDPGAVAAEGGTDALIDQPAPDFTVVDLDGEEVSLGSLRGRVVVLDFWATWCGPCRMVMPELSAWQDRWGDDGLTVLGISDEPRGVVAKFVAKGEARGKTFSQRLALEQGQVRRDYGVSSLPTMVVVDPAGTVREVHVGAGGLDDVERLVARLLGEPTDEVIP